ARQCHHGADLSVRWRGSGVPRHRLRDIPVGRGHSVLRRLPSQVFGEPAWPAPLGEPRWWADAGQAYAQLLLSNRNYVTGVQRGRLGSIISVGSTLQNALGRVSANDAGSGTGNTLFNDLLRYYGKWGPDGVDG